MFNQSAFVTLVCYSISEAKYVILASPRIGLLDRLDPMHMREGGVLARFIKDSSKRIVMVVSGNLSHLYDYETKEEAHTPISAKL